MKYVVGKFIIGRKTKEATIPLGQVMAGDSEQYPRSIECTSTNGGQTLTTIATYVLPVPAKKPKLTNVAPLAPTTTPLQPK